ncbi:recombinase family protein [Actinomadura formosensis]|uniref:recombinase family protein n=1 Tax=Actinomadura formosensis TaxID=60706 RepID=UPI000834B468|nr:recombinase family protein [Actinomadura formosensis]
MRPVMYGYMRVVGGDAMHGEIARLGRELAAYAEREGFALDEVFTEKMDRSEPAFSCLIDAIKRNDVRDIIVPSLWHFARLPGLQDAMRQHIEHETGARVWVVQGQRR